MVENDIHISLKETIALSKKVVFINYNPKDEPYTTPLKDLIHRVNMDYATTANLGSTKDDAFDLTINIVTESGIFNDLKSHPSSNNTQIAPFSIALSTYSCPSVENPFIATNKYPFFTS